MNEQNLITYYNKFNEDKRLNTKHGQVEFITSMKYIHEYLKDMENPKILDIGAGCGKYSGTLSNEGYDVTAIELVKHNLRVIEKNYPKVKTYQGNAIDLSRFKTNSFDLVLLFGPMYHILDKENQIKALNEAKRVMKKEGILIVAYCMNEYAVITHAFKENYIHDCIHNKQLDTQFHCRPNQNDLYHYMRLEDIDFLNKKTNLTRIKIVAADGPANYMRSVLNQMDEATFNKFIEYHLSTCERLDLIGASAHTIDILTK